MITQQIHIDLHLPQSWNHCTTDELESIAAAIINEQQRVDKYHPFDWGRVKLIVALSINEITVNEELRMKNEEFATATENSDTEWLVKRPQDKEPWTITTGQLVALTERLAWVDDEKANKIIFLFPYPTLDVRCKKEDVRAIRHQTSAIIHLQGPPPLLDGYTWKEYRWLTDWMQEYIRQTNAMAQSKMEDVRRKNQEAAAQAQREFLAILFKPAEKPTGVSDKTADHDDGGSKFFTLHSSLFTSFDPVKWQVILFWWSSLMLQLQRKFPKVFKPQSIGKGKRPQKDTPWDFYNRVTATIQKYIGGLSSHDVDDQPYGVTLQQLEMMADEAAEMEKLKRKK